MLNKVIVQGRLTADPELRATNEGVPVTTITVAVERSHADKNGNRAADFIDIVCWRGLAEFVAKNLSKGRKILAEGSLQSRKYTDRKGENRIKWEIVASDVLFDDYKKDAPAAATYTAPEAAEIWPDGEDEPF